MKNILNIYMNMINVIVGNVSNSNRKLVLD